MVGTVDPTGWRVVGGWRRHTMHSPTFFVRCQLPVARQTSTHYPAELMPDLSLFS
jgi:hypothetical protein